MKHAISAVKSRRRLPHKSWSLRPPNSLPAHQRRPLRGRIPRSARRLAQRLLLLLALPMQLLPGCEPAGLDHPFGRPRREVEGEVKPRGGGTEGAGVPFLTGVEFPDSYDWERDTAYGRAPCRLVLFAGGERILTVEAGPEAEVSPDPDMHRVLGGHLFTDYSTDTETVIRENGVERVRFAGRESIRGIRLVDGRLHTLGERRDGSGFAYRVDGEAVFSRDKGVLLPGGNPVQEGPLYVEDGAVCFSYYIPGRPPSVFLVRDGVSEAVEMDPATEEILDQRLWNRVLYRVEKRSYNRGRPFLVANGAATLLAGEPRLSPSGEKCRLVPGANEMLVRGWYRYPDGSEEFLLWRDRGTLLEESRPLQAFSLLPAGEDAYHIGCVLNPPSGLQICKDGQTWEPVGRYRLYDPACAALNGSVYYVALSGPSCILWADGVVTPIQLHGYLSGVYPE